MANTTLHFNLKAKVDGSGDVKQLSVDMESLSKAVDKAQKGLAKPLNLAAVSVLADQFSGAISSLSSAMGDLVDAYQQQVQVEVQLETVMRQRMNATDAEIQSIKDLTAAQQQLGIIGDEVQLAGAQQLATFLSNKDALVTLIPAMNNLVAQQKGYNATAQDAVTIGNLFGKAMQGQTSALRRVGITFTAAEESALKMANEEDRAAQLAQIITNNVGQMNAQLAQTPTGQLKQLSNYMGDLKEQAGAFASKMMPIVVGLNAIVLAGTNGIKIFAGLKAAVVSLGTAVVGFVTGGGLVKFFNIIVSGASKGLAAVAPWAAAAAPLLAVAGGIAAIAKGMKPFNDSIDEAAVKMKTMNDLNADANAKMQVEVTTLNSLIKTAADETKTMEERNAALQQANSIVPNFNAHIDATTSKIHGNTSALKEYNKELKRKYLLEGAKQMYADLGNQLAQAIVAQTNAQKAYNAELEFQKNQREKQGNQPQFGPFQAMGNAGYAYAARGALEDANKKVKTLTGSIDALNESFGASLLAEQNTAKAPAVSAPAAAPATKTAKTTGGGSGRGRSGSTPRATTMGKIGSFGFSRILPTMLEDVNYTPQAMTAPKMWDGDTSVLTSLSLIEAAIQRVRDLRANAAQEDIAGFDAQIKGLESYRLSFEGTSNVVEESMKKWSMIGDGVSNLASIFNNLGSAISGTAGEWLKWMGNVINSIAQVIPMIASMVMANKAQATSGAISSAMQLPPPFNYIMLAANLAAVVAAFAQIPAFAEGGIAFGPTLGVFGEYSGAKSNPEVVAPLDRLRSMLDGGAGGDVEFRISGDSLVGVLNKRNRKMSRT